MPVTVTAIDGDPAATADVRVTVRTLPLMVADNPLSTTGALYVMLEGGGEPVVTIGVIVDVPTAPAAHPRTSGDEGENCSVTNVVGVPPPQVSATATLRVDVVTPFDT